METGKTNKKGISLIVLVITIIVMIILAATIIISLNNNGIINKANNAVQEYNLDEVKNLASLAWAEAYMDGNRTQEDLESKVRETLTTQNIDLDQYRITVTTKGVDVMLNPVVATVDGVPIPRGFVASSATGENTKNGGLVIYEGTEPVTDANVETAKRTRNQYVWVPVAKEEFVTKFVRQNFGLSKTISNTLGTNYWEVVLDTATNMPLSTQDAKYMTSTTLKEVQAMYASVKEYEGFYIARYEAGIDAQRTKENYKDATGNIILAEKVYSMMGKIPYNFVPWTKNNSMSQDTNGAVEVARSIYPETNEDYGVVSTLIYGVQWDRTLAWWLEVGAKDGKGNTITSVTNSTAYGNHSDHVISAGDLNEGAKYAVYTNSTLGTYQETTSETTKASGTYWALTTGALKVARVNNIYDMAGNMYEWTMEGRSSNHRVDRGGHFSIIGGDFPVSDRDYNNPDHARYSIGFRPSLYIKK